MCVLLVPVQAGWDAIGYHSLCVNATTRLLLGLGTLIHGSVA